MSREPDPSASSSSDATAFAGKRRAPRKRRVLSIECRGAGGLRLEAKTQDVSRGGMLVELTDPSVIGGPRTSATAKAPNVSQRLTARGQDVLALFPDGLDVAFGEGAVLAHARIARFITDPNRPEAVLLGCRFVPALSPVDCTLLGVDFDGDETHGDDAHPAPSLSRTPSTDVLLNLIETPDRAWSDHHVPTDVTPVVARKPLPKIRMGGRVDVPAPSAPPPPPPPAPVAVPAHAARIAVPAPTLRVAVAPPAADRTAAPTASPAPAPTPLPAPSSSAEGLTDEDLRRMGRERAATPIAAVRGRAADWVGAGRVAVYLFPTMAGALGPRYHGRLELFDERNIVVDLPVPTGESDPVGHASGLGEQVRSIFVREGRVLGEAACRVIRLDAMTEGTVRVALRAAVAPDPRLAGQIHTPDVDPDM